MTRNLFWIVVGLALVASCPTAAKAQESAEGAPDAQKADAGAPAQDSGAAPSQSQSDASEGGATQDSQASGSQPATTGEAAGSLSTTNTNNTQNAAPNTSQPADDASTPPAAKPNDPKPIPSPQQPKTDDTRKPAGQDDAAPGSNHDASAKGRANVDPQAQRRGQDMLKRGLQFGQATGRGLAINEVDQGSIYFRSGFRRGDIIVSLYGRPVRSQADFMRFVVLRPGRRIPVIVLRNGRQHTIYVAYPQEVVQTHRIYDHRVPAAGGAYLGVMFNPQVRDAAVVLSVNQGSPAEKAGLQPNDVILAMNGKEIRSYPEVISVIRSMRPGQEVDIVVARGESETQLFAVLDAQANVRTANRPVDVHVEQRTIQSNQPAGVQIEVNERRDNGRDRDGDNDGNPGRSLLPRLGN